MDHLSGNVSISGLPSTSLAYAWAKDQRSTSLFLFLKGQNLLRFKGSWQCRIGGEQSCYSSENRNKSFGMCVSPFGLLWEAFVMLWLSFYWYLALSQISKSSEEKASVVWNAQALSDLLYPTNAGVFKILSPFFLYKCIRFLRSTKTCLIFIPSVCKGLCAKWRHFWPNNSNQKTLWFLENSNQETL